MKEFLLKNDNLKIVEELSKVIPRAKAEIEFKFWNELKEEIGAELEEYNFSLDEVSSGYEMNEIEDNRKKQWLATQIFYVYGDYFNENVLSIGIANAKADDDFYFFFQMFDKNVEIVELKNIEEELLEKLRGLFSKASYKSKYLWKHCDTDFQYENKNFYKLQDKAKRGEIIKKMKDGFFEIAIHIDENRSEIGEILKGI